MFSVPALPYGYDALEPIIDQQTMQIHHDKHHQAYVDKLNAALEKYPELAQKTIEEILVDFENVPADIQVAVRNHGGGYANHSLFWTVLAPVGQGGQASGDLSTAITSTFGSYKSFQEQFQAAAAGQFGSGWAWLVLDGDSLKITATPNQDSPLLQAQTPLFGVDVWEHAYYLHYQNKRPDYVTAIWRIVNWTEVERRYVAAHS